MKVSYLLLAVVIAPAARAQTVRAVLFHSPTCPHCRQVITEDLPIFFDVYGGPPTVSRGEPHLRLLSNGTLTILFVDASQPAGETLYEASYGPYPVSPERRGVPRLIVGDSVLVGSVEIPTRLHAIIRNGLAGGGIPWPTIPGLDGVTARLDPDGVPASQTGVPPPIRDTGVLALPPDSAHSAETGVREDTVLPANSFDAVGAEPTGTVGQRLRRDPVGSGLAILGLVLMVLTLAAVSAGVPARVGPRNPGVWLPLLAVVGAGVAAYLTYVETTGTTAVCGPVGDCNTVQQSPYATVAGVIPVGALGVAGYGLILVLWVLAQEGRPTAVPARRLLVAGALVGTLFSVYLTALEPFVIGATCMWCLSSAAIMTVVLWLASAWAGSSGIDNPANTL